MKKLIKMLAAAAMVACGLMMSGCTEEEINEILGPTDTWCTMPVTYTSGDNSVSLNVSLYYASKEVKNSGTVATELRTVGAPTSIPAGSISILVTTQSTSNAVVSGLTKSTYIFKSYGSVSEFLSDGESSASYDSTRLLWTAVYRSLNSKGKFTGGTSTTVPAQLQYTTQETYSSVTDLENFSWKTLLKSYLINSL